jgi:hypothetical protein
VIESGERGRNRTFNLLFLYQPLKTNGFNDFPTILVGRNRQFEARLLRNLLRNFLQQLSQTLWNRKEGVRAQIREHGSSRCNNAWEKVDFHLRAHDLID